MALQRKGGLLGLLNHLFFRYRESGFHGIRKAASALEAHVILPDSYAKWIAQFDLLNDVRMNEYKVMLGKLDYLPLISVVMPTFNSNPKWLKLAIESVRSQIYPNWELCIADDASTNSNTIKTLKSYSFDPRIKIVYRQVNGHISNSSNSAIDIASGDWLALLDHDDLIPQNALLEVARTIQKNPNAKMIYTDEDKIDAYGRRFSPYFKSEWNQDLFYSHNLFSHFGCYKTGLVREVGAFRLGYEGSQDYDLALRCIEKISKDQILHIPKVLYHWRVHAESTASSIDAKPYAILAGQKALNEHFVRSSINAKVSCLNYGYRVIYELPPILPKVSIIIPTRNGLKLLRQCIDSIESKTTYSNYEIIIMDNGSDDPALVEYFKELSTSPKFKIVRADGAFNYSQLNNIGVESCSGDYVALLNNDVEVITPNWLTEMVSMAVQPGIGAVGARLIYPNKTLQHCGVILGMGGIAGHPHRYFPSKDNGYFGRASLIQSFSAVTAACLVVSKAHYQSVGGLDAINLKVAYNDIDFCLRLREKGLRNVWTPYAELFHHESATRGPDNVPEQQRRFSLEIDYMKEKWGHLLHADPAYNPNLTLDSENFDFAWPPRTHS